LRKLQPVPVTKFILSCQDFEAGSKSPTAKRAKLSEIQPTFESPKLGRKKNVLEDISNFRTVAEFVSQPSSTTMSAPYSSHSGDSKILRRIPGVFFLFDNRFSK
jgi:hypothetical protein